MKFIARFLYVPLAGLLVLTSCAKDETESYDKFENQALEAWMTQHRSDLVENLQSEGLYYVDLLSFLGSSFNISTRPPSTQPLPRPQKTFLPLASRLSK